MSEADLNRELVRLKAEQARLEKDRNAAETAASRARAEAHTKSARASRATSPSTASTHLRQVQAAEKTMNAQTKKAADLSKKLADNSRRQTALLARLDAAQKASRRRDELEASRRRAAEKAHAREVARRSQPTAAHEVRVIEPPKPEDLRVLYLAANPHGDLRVDVEVRAVREAVERALYRDQISIDHRPAATPEDLLDGINRSRPHVVHFAGHAGGRSLLFDDALIRDEGDQTDGTDIGRPINFALLARALGATAQPPKMLVLNACDTLDGAESLLDVVPVVIAMASSVSDLAAGVFAARFYAAVGAGQSVQAAIDQGAVAARHGPAGALMAVGRVRCDLLHDHMERHPQYDDLPRDADDQRGCPRTVWSPYDGRCRPAAAPRCCEGSEPVRRHRSASGPPRRAG